MICILKINYYLLSILVISFLFLFFNRNLNYLSINSLLFELSKSLIFSTFYGIINISLVIHNSTFPLGRKVGIIMFRWKTVGITLIGIVIVMFIALILKLAFIRALVFTLVLIALGVFFGYKTIFSLGNSDWDFFKRVFKAFLWLFILVSYIAGLCYFLPLLWSRVFH